MDRLAAANCADKNDWLTVKAMVCPKVPNASSAPCAAAKGRAKTCQAQFQQSTILCNGLNQTDTTDPCAIDMLLGVFCVASINSNLCMSTACTSSTDCGTGYSCNEQTGHCFRSSTGCLGLPCASSTDCSTGYTCNTAIAQCVRN